MPMVATDADAGKDKIPGGVTLPGVPYVMNGEGNVSRFSIDGNSIVDQLPVNHAVKATAASTQGVFAITLGPPPTADARPR